MEDFEAMNIAKQTRREILKDCIRAEVSKDDFTAIEQQILEELRRLESYAHNLATSLEAIQAARAAQREHQARVMQAVGLFFDGKMSQSRLYEEYISG